MDTSFICIESTVTIRAGAAAFALEALKAYASPPVRSVLSSLINPLRVLPTPFSTVRKPRTGRQPMVRGIRCARSSEVRQWQARSSRFMRGA